MAASGVSIPLYPNLLILVTVNLYILTFTVNQINIAEFISQDTDNVSNSQCFFRLPLTLFCRNMVHLSSLPVKISSCIFYI